MSPSPASISFNSNVLTLLQGWSRSAPAVAGSLDENADAAVAATASRKRAASANLDQRGKAANQSGSPRDASQVRS